jgi:hypothetical protein
MTMIDDDAKDAVNGKSLRSLLRDVGEYLVIRQQYCDVFSGARLVRNGRLTWPLAIAVGQVLFLRPPLVVYNHHDFNFPLIPHI